MSSKPIFAVVPGAFHNEPSWNSFVAKAKDAGYECHVSSLSSANDAAKGLPDDIAKIREILVLPLLDSGEDVVLLLHSFAGLPGSASLQGLTKSERKLSGKAGALIGVIYVAAFVPSPGASLKSVLGDKWEPWQTEDEAAGLVNVTGDAKQVFYADMSDTAAQLLVDNLVGHSVLAMITPCPANYSTNAAYNGRRGYVRCSEDQAIPVFAQDGMLKRSGVDWDVREMTSSHSPFASQPAELWEHIRGLSEKFSQV